MNIQLFIRSFISIQLFKKIRFNRDNSVNFRVTDINALLPNGAFVVFNIHLPTSVSTYFFNKKLHFYSKN